MRRRGAGAAFSAAACVFLPLPPPLRRMAPGGRAGSFPRTLPQGAGAPLRPSFRDAFPLAGRARSSRATAPSSRPPQGTARSAARGGAAGVPGAAPTERGLPVHVRGAPARTPHRPAGSLPGPWTPVPWRWRRGRAQRRCAAPAAPEILRLREAAFGRCRSGAKVRCGQRARGRARAGDAGERILRRFATRRSRNRCANVLVRHRPIHNS